MSVTHKTAATVVILLLAVSVVPSAVAGLSINEIDWDQKFDETDGYGELDGSNDNLKEVYVNETNTKVRFRANISGGNDGLNNDDALQVYIDADTDVETGLTDDTVSGGNWKKFYDGVGTMGADYRISVRDGGSPIIQEYTDGSFETIDSINMTETGKSVMLESEKETIENPETFDAKFVYIADTATSNVEDNDYVWAPDAPIRFADSVEAIGTATVDAKVEFGDEPVDSDATVVFELKDDGETVDTIENSAYSSSGTLSEQFTVNNDSYNGQVELAVDVQNDEDYSLDRENINNTVEITTNGLDEDDTKSGKIALSIIEAKVAFGAKDPDDEASVEFTLRDDEPNEVANPVVTDVTDPTRQNFTVNPYDFNDEGELSVDVNNDDDYPYSETKSVSDISVGSSLTVETFEASKIGHDFTLDPEGDSSVNIENDDGFTTNVSLKSDDTEGSNVTSVTHVMNYDSENLNESDINVEVNNTFNDPQNYTFVKDTVDEAGKYGIEIYSLNLTDKPVVEEGEYQHLYEIELNFSDGLQGELSQGNNVIEFTPTTADETEIFNQTDGETPLSYTSSRAKDVNVDNSETRITNVEITHKTDGGVMEDVQAIIDVRVESNQGELSNITLNKTDGSAFPHHDEDDNHVIKCDGGGPCESLSGKLRYTPTEDNVTTFGGNYQSEPFFNITARNENGDVYSLNSFESTVYAEIYYFGDVDPGTDKTAVETQDVRTVIQNRGEGDGTLPLDPDSLARSDLNSDGEITIADVTKIVEEYNP